MPYPRYLMDRDPRTVPIPCQYDNCFIEEAAAAEPAPPAPVAGAPAVTIRDVASFAPQKPENVMEPGGWGIVKLPTNFIAAANAHTVTGTLLGGPAEVRFTPVGYQWAYGDGQSKHLSEAGATWTKLGLPEFSETATSHTYAERGTYTVELSARYTAEYRVGSASWTAITGTLSVAAAPRTIIVATGTTVLVEHNCRIRPTGPGC